MTIQDDGSLFYFLEGEFEIVKLLMDRDLTRHIAYVAAFGDRDKDQPPHLQELSQLMFKLKRKLKDFDVEIHAVYKNGWSLTPENRERLNAFISGCALSPAGIPVKRPRTRRKGWAAARQELAELLTQSPATPRVCDLLVRPRLGMVSLG
jgi:hypothetical protein